MPRLMSLSNVNMPCIQLFRLVIIVLFHYGAPSPTQHASDTYFVPPPTHAVTSPSTYRHSMPRFTSTVPAPYHTHCLYIMTQIYPTTHRNLLLLFSVPNALDDQF